QLAASLAGATKIEQLQITQLAGDLAVATLAMPKPISITGLGTNSLSASGAVKLTGAIQQVTPLLAVLQGQPPMTYAGKYDLPQDISTQQNQIALKGEIAVP